MIAPRTPMAGDRGPFYLLIALGGVALAVLGFSFAQFVYFEPPGEHSDIRAPITSVATFDPVTGTLGPAAGGRFAPGQVFAATVDWSAVPRAALVGATWTSGPFATDFGGVGPARAADLAGRPIPIRPPARAGAASILPPGPYTLSVLRYAGGRPVEVLARRQVLVVTAR